MERKFLAKLLAVSMAVTAVPVLPGIEAGADAKELGITSQKIESGYSDSVKNNRKAGADVPGTNFANVATQPAISYTFDSTEGLELAGEANVSDGVLNLATKETYNETYAKIADISGIDFSDGITLTADVKVTGYKGDWTSIFMLGDGTVGGEGTDATGLYHFSQGFSSVGGSRENTSVEPNWFIGYFGNGIASPYVFDWYNNTDNQNKWDTITVTIDRSEMITYINGVQVQSGTTGYDVLMDVFKVARNNYLGVSYFPADADFQGSLDNVGIYRTVLSAEDVKKLTSTEAKPVETPEPTAPPTADKLDCAGYHTAFSGGYEVTGDGTTVTFDSETYADAIDAWNSPAVIVYSAEAPASHSINYDTLKDAAGFSELLYVRGDWWGEAKIGDVVYNRATFNEGPGTWMARGLPSDWSLFLASNKEGVKGEASAKYEDGKILVKFSVNGVTNLISIPYEKQEGKNIYLSLSGEKCKLSNIAESAFTGITIPSGIATYPVNMPTPTPAPTLPPVDENATPAPTPLLEPETLTGTAWWDGSQKGRDYTLSGQGTLDLYVTFDSTTDSNGYGAFNVELLSDGNKYITTGSDDNAWVAEEGTGTVVDAANTGSTIVAGHVYKISVKRTGYDFSVVYYDLTDNKEYCSMEIKNTNQAIDVNVHIIAQVGKFIVSQSAPDVVTPPTTATPAPSTDPAATPEPGITPAPGATATPGTTPDPGTTVDPGTQTPGTTATRTECQL